MFVCVVLDPGVVQEDSGQRKDSHTEEVRYIHS